MTRPQGRTGIPKICEPSFAPLLWDISLGTVPLGSGWGIGWAEKLGWLGLAFLARGWLPRLLLLCCESHSSGEIGASHEQNLTVMARHTVVYVGNRETTQCGQLAACVRGACSRSRDEEAVGTWERRELVPLVGFFHLRLRLLLRLLLLL